MNESGAAAAPKAAAVPTPAKPATAQPAPAPAAAAPAKGWRIKFVPGPDLLRHGNDPLRILRELATLGKMKVAVDAGGIPPLVELDPEVCRLRWNIEINGDLDALGDRKRFRVGRKRMRTVDRTHRRRAGCHA